MSRLVYQSNKSKLRSAPVDESDIRRRAVFERAGWRVVEALDDGETPSTPPATPSAGDPLPADFPCREALVGLGITTVQALHGVKGLQKTKGIGPKGWAAIRERLGLRA